MMKYLYRVSVVFVNNGHFAVRTAQQQRISVVYEAGREKNAFTLSHGICSHQQLLTDIVASELIEQIIRHKPLCILRDRRTPAVAQAVRRCEFSDNEGVLTRGSLAGSSSEHSVCGYPSH